MTYLKFDPARSGLLAICKLLPVNSGVRHSARLLLINSIRAADTRLQINFLEKIRKNQLLTTKLYNMKIPIGTEKSHHGGRGIHGNKATIQELALRDTHNNYTYNARAKFQENVNKRAWQFKRFILKSMINEKYCELREFQGKTDYNRHWFQKWATPEHRRMVNTIVDDECARKRNFVTKKHDRKYAAILKMQRPSNGTTHKAKTLKDKGYKGVIIRAAGIINNKVLPLLDKGKNFKMTPNNNDIVKGIQTGTERLACTLRYTNPFFITNPNYNATPQTPHSITQVTKIFSRTDLQPPPIATAKIEEKITELKKNASLWSSKVKKLNIKKNTDKKEIEALKELQKQPNISIQLTDKTSKIAIVDKDMAYQKLKDHIESSNFELLKKDPTQKYEKSINGLLQDIYEEDPNVADSIPFKNYSRLTSQNSEAPPIFSMQKDHKENYPDCKIRPVQPIYNSAILKADVLVSKVLTQILPQLKYRIPNTKTFLGRINSLKNEIKFQASLDVENMFPTMPTSHKAISTIRRYLEEYMCSINLFGFRIEHIIALLEHVITKSYIKFDGKYYKQLKGVCTGSHTSPAYSEIIIDHTYNRAIENINIKPEGLSLYMDDAWMGWVGDMESFIKFKDMLNKIWPGEMVFTHEIESENNSINFLDTSITRKREGGFEYEFYQKPTHSGKYLDFRSHCPISTKINIIKTEAQRIISNCSSMDKAWPHLEKLRENLTDSYYPHNFATCHILKVIQIVNNPSLAPNNKEKPKFDYVYTIPYVSEAITRKIKKCLKDLDINARVVATSGKSLKNQLKEKSPNNCKCTLCQHGITCTQKNIVYEASCNKCHESYVGATSRPSIKRILEHESSVRLKNNRTTIGQHFQTHYPKSSTVTRSSIKKTKPDLENFLKHFKFTKIDQAKDSFGVFILEGLAIAKKKPKINNMMENGWIR